MHFNIVYSNTKNAESRVHQSQVCYLRIEEWVRLENWRFCILCVRINHFDVHLLVSSREVDPNVLRMAN